ncbi:MAG: hypothetical protein HY306_03225 [Nitrosomonadales bacterium]|nr:hypothetical protein [Nitrosomonadales bacterium]
MEQQLIKQRIASASAHGAELIAALQEKITKLNLPGDAITIPQFEAARFTLEHDLYNGQQTLRAAFFPSQHYCIGFLLFHSDGSSFAEYHIMRPHPNRPALFIEAVEAWVRDGKIQTDTRLAMMPT